MNIKTFSQCILFLNSFTWDDSKIRTLHSAGRLLMAQVFTRKETGDQSVLAVVCCTADI